MYILGNSLTASDWRGEAHSKSILNLLVKV